MIIIADSGSTKTNWAIVDNDIRYIETIGLNPNFISDEQLQENIFQVFEHIDTSRVQAVHFFGSGCGLETNKQRLKICFEKFISSADIFIDTDLTGAAIALFGREKGIACILGTGANAGLYDGEKITHTPKSLGYILGDAGSGAVLGMLLLRKYLQNKLPVDIAQKLEAAHNVDYPYLLENVYKKERPNRFFATFTSFVSEYRDVPIIQDLLTEQFNEFFRYFIFPYPEARTNPVRMVGSVAFYFQNELKEIAKKHDIVIDTILRQPIKNLITNIITK